MAGLGKETCGATGKECFDSKESAREMLGRYAHAKGSRKAYPCPFGQHWHLTKGARGKKFGRR